jgi:hypothetical protein
MIYSHYCLIGLFGSIKVFAPFEFSESHYPIIYIHICVFVCVCVCVGFWFVFC